MLQLFDTASLSIRELEPRDRGAVGLYVCGPTVYGPPHVGHGRTVLTYDILRRYLEYRGHVVRHVSNVTDIDDKIIQRARDEDRDWTAVAAEWEQVWWKSMDRLGVLRPTVRPRATEYVERMIELIDSLVKRSMAYRTRDGVYLKAAMVPDYGLLSHQSAADRLAGSRVEVDELKEDPIDFALWKGAKPGEPVWPSPWGDGRPGWHTECVVMALDLLGEDFDLHGGGRDLIFPHHENERAQAVADGRRFARHWMHSGLVTVSGEKMSKSLGNFTELSELLENYDARSYRMLALGAHYRSPLEVNAASIESAEGALSRVDRFVARLEDVSGAGADPAAGEALRRSFVEAMDDDLDSPRALAELFEAIRAANAAIDRGEAAEAAHVRDAVAELLGAMGVSLRSGRHNLDDSTRALVERRNEARKARDFATSDDLRAQLESLGWSVEDLPDGTSRVHRLPG